MRAADMHSYVADLPEPWDLLTVQQAVYVRHRVANYRQIEIASRYAVSESSVCAALGRAAATLGFAREREMIVAAAREGVAPLLLTDVKFHDTGACQTRRHARRVAMLRSGATDDAR